jgi:transmembrane sensor
VAACAFATFGGGVFVMLNHRASAQTAVGDQELRRLPDGGKLHINTNSKVQWRFSGQRREVWLNQGEIALNVPEDARPLYLYAADQVVELRSGQLNARLRNGALDLLMLEGQAEVQEDGRSGKVRVATGQAALAGSANIRLRPMSPGDIQFVSAWQAGEIYFNGETLGAAVDEYNRYLPYKIVIGDPSLQGVRLGGRFKSHDPQLFLTSLRDSFGVVASRTSDGTVVLTL